MRGAIDERTQRAIALLRKRIRRRDGRILLRFDDEPAAIAMALQPGDDAREIDRAVAGHRECAVQHRVEKTPVAVARELHDRRPYVLAVHVTDTRDMLVEHIERIAARERDMPGIEQQADRIAG